MESDNEDRAELIGPTIPDVEGTEPRLIIPPVDGPCPMSAPTFDESGDYPSDETLQAIRNWPAMRINELFEFVLAAWHWPDWATTELRPCEREQLNAEGGERFLRLATGGWSGNEEIIGALDDNLWARSRWCLSQRGGLHIYECREIGTGNQASMEPASSLRSAAQK